MEKLKRWPTIIIFIALQVAWIFIVVIGVVWYIRNNATALGRPIGTWDIVIMIEGSVLLLLILAGIYVLFILYQRQLTLMRTQMHFISSITHAFKTPLATMQLYLETIEKRELPEETKDRLLKGMMAENQRLKSLVDNFLASARFSYSRRPYVFARTSLSEFMDDFLKRSENLLKDVDVHVNIREDLDLFIDKGAMNLVFSNLAENAIHYSTDILRVDLEAWREGSWAYIRFSDYGAGIPKERYRDIFKMFQRLPEAIALWGSGTGMGLYVVKMIIKAHGGSIRVSPWLKDQGTSFLIRLPVVKQ